MCVSVCESFVWLWLKVHQKLNKRSTRQNYGHFLRRFCKNNELVSRFEKKFKGSF